MTSPDFHLVALSDRVLVEWAFDLLKRSDKEFVPPLSHRIGTGMNFATATTPPPGVAGIERYFDDLKQQQLVFARIAGVPAGFLSFRPEIQNACFGQFQPVNYVTTICIEPEFRGCGIGAGFYRFMLSNLPADHQLPFTGTRTWSTNESHIHLLKNMGFDVACTLPNDRAPGVDTVYFYRQSTSPEG